MFTTRQDFWFLKKGSESQLLKADIFSWLHWVSADFGPCSFICLVTDPGLPMWKD